MIGGMFFMVRVSFQMMCLAILAWQLWVVLGLIGIVAAIAHRLAQGSEPPARPQSIWRVLVAVLLLIPLVMLAYGLYLWPESGQSPDLENALTTLDVLGLSQFAVSLSAVWWNRSRLGSAVAISVASTWWAIAAHATASMAVRNQWL